MKIKDEKIKATYSFDFEKKIAYMNDEYYGEILKYDDTSIEVQIIMLGAPVIQEFRLHIPQKNESNE